MDERNWRIPALHGALLADGFELSRATLYRVVEGRSPLPADLALWAMAKLGQSVDAQLGIEAADRGGRTSGAAEFVGELEEAIYRAGLRLAGRLLAPDLADALLSGSADVNEPPAKAAETAVPVAPQVGLQGTRSADETNYAVNEARLRLRSRSRQILSEMAGASLEDSQGSVEAVIMERASSGAGGK